MTQDHRTRAPAVPGWGCGRRPERRPPIVQPPPAGQDRRHVTGVTERVSEGVHFNRPIQPINLICAIAPPPEATDEFPEEPSPDRDPASPTPPAESPGRPVRDRSAQVRGVRREEPEAIRKRRRAGAGGPRAQRSRWTRRSPARSGRLTRGVRETGSVGADHRVVWSYGVLCEAVTGARRVGGPGNALFQAVLQASLRCCGMPASSARTSASR